MSVCKGRRKTENPPPFFFDYLSFFLIRIFWIGQDPLPLMKKMVKQLSFWSKMVKKKLTQFLVKKGQKKFGLWPRPSKSLHIAFLLRCTAGVVALRGTSISQSISPATASEQNHFLIICNLLRRGDHNFSEFQNLTCRPDGLCQQFQQEHNSHNSHSCSAPREQVIPL